MTGKTGYQAHMIRTLVFIGHLMIVMPCLAADITIDFTNASQIENECPNFIQINHVGVRFTDAAGNATSQEMPSLMVNILWGFNDTKLILEIKDASEVRTDFVSEDCSVLGSQAEWHIDFRESMAQPTAQINQILVQGVQVGSLENHNISYDILWEFRSDNLSLVPIAVQQATPSNPPDISWPPSICDNDVKIIDTTQADHIIGSGTPASCTEKALANALADGGIVTFDCGANPVEIVLSQELKISRDTVLDGHHLITLGGAGKTRIINMDTDNFEALGPQLTVQRLVFKDGLASGTPVSLGFDIDGGGGAIFYRGGSVTAIDCRFINNTAAEIGPDVGGGAIYGVGRGETIISGCWFEGNSAANGGAIGALHTGITLINSYLGSNTANGHGANYVDAFGQQQGHGGNGGAIVMDGNGRTLYICGTTIQNNRGGALGGAIFRTGYESEPTIIDRCTIDGNQVIPHDDPELQSSGGGVYLQGNHVQIKASIISNNTSDSYAGVWILGHGPEAPGYAELINVTIAGNYTRVITPFTERGIGAGLIIGENTTGSVQNCTIVNNAAQFAAGIINVSPLIVKNSIIANSADNIWTPLELYGDPI